MKEITRYYVRLFMFLFPMAFLPIVVDPFGFGKNWLVLAMGMVGLVLWVIDLLVNKRESFKFNKMFVLVVGLTLWALIGWLRLTPGVQMRSFMDFGGIGTISAMLVWFFLWLQVTNKEEAKVQLNWLTAAGILVTVTSIVVFMLPTSKLPIIWPKDNPVVSINTVWSLTGSLLSEGILLLFLVMEWGKRLWQKLKNEENSGYILEAIVVAVFILALLLDILRIFKAGWINLDGVSAWVIAAETFKRSPIWGVGIGNFWEAFNSFRPTSYNLTQVWAEGFKYSSSGLLQLWTELGVVGLVIIGLMASGLVRQAKNYDWVKLVVIGLIVLFLPMNLLGLVLLTWIAATSVFEKNKAGLALKVGESGFNVAPWMAGFVLTSAVVFGGYHMYRVVMGEMYMRQSLVAAAKNDGGGTYNLQIEAINKNQTSAEYRKMYSQTNLALAKSVLSNKEVSDEDKQKASTLIQQSVREAKAAISLDSLNPNYWTNLAVIYRQLIGVVDGSADWSFQAYQQAAVLDPSNPIIKLDLGGLLFAAQRYDEADRVFEQVVIAKQDFANGWYNWAYTAKQTNRLESAVQRLTQALALVPKDSGDYEKASKELDVWKKELEEATKKLQAQQQQQAPKVAETLRAPEPMPTVGQEEKVDIPATEMQPPVITPQVTPEASPDQSTGGP